MITVKIYITPKLLKAMQDNQNFESAVLKSLSRFTSKDWGDLCREDKQSNDIATICGGRILGRYETGLKAIYIITEANHKTTTIMFADEY